jgi:hypothetical protein
MADTAARQASGEEAYHSVRKEGMITNSGRLGLSFASHWIDGATRVSVSYFDRRSRR